MVRDRMTICMMGRPTPGVTGRVTRCLLIAVAGRAVRCPAAESDDSVMTGIAGGVLR